MYKTTCVVFLLLLTTGCKQYSFSINDKTLYEPPSLFQDYAVADAALRQCLTDTIVERKIYEAKHLNILMCSGIGVTSTEGLNQFTHLAVLDLSDNDLRAVPEILELSHLRHLNLAGNDQLSCVTISKLAGSIAQLVSPEQCNK